MTEFLCDLFNSNFFSTLAGHLVAACFAWGFFKRRLAADKALAAVREKVDEALAAARQEFEQKLAAAREKFERDLAATQNRRNTQNTSFYDLILKTELSQEWMKIRTRVEFMKANNRLAGSLTDEEKLAVRMYLNHYECVAMAIQEEIIPQELYWKSFGGAFVRAWEGLEEYVAALRKTEKRSGLYKEFQKLATGTEPEHPTEEES